MVAAHNGNKEIYLTLLTKGANDALKNNVNKKASEIFSEEHPEKFPELRTAMELAAAVDVRALARRDPPAAPPAQRRRTR